MPLRSAAGEGAATRTSARPSRTSNAATSSLSKRSPPGVLIPPADTHLDEEAEEHEHTVADVAAASKLRGFDVRRWFARQIMLPEWMVDAPPQLASDWHVFARPSGKRCLVVSSNGMTISRVRKGSIIHRFPSALPNGSKKDISGPVSSYSILDCIFHEPDQTYYITDTIYWGSYSLYDCTAEFRFSG